MRRNPFDDIEEMLDRVSRQVEEGMSAGGLQVPGSVPVDVADTDEQYVVTADLPGYETDDIELTLSGRDAAPRGQSDRRGGYPGANTSGASGPKRRRVAGSACRSRSTSRWPPASRTAC